MKLLLLAVAVFALANGKSLSTKRGMDRNDEWFEPVRNLGTDVIVETFGIEGVRDLVKETVEKCMQEDDVTDCLEDEVDTVSDALGQDVPQKDRQDAKVKVAALSDFLGAVHGACRDVPEDKIGECAFNTGKQLCGESDFDQKECMKGVMFVLGKAKEMADKMEDKKSEKRGVERDDEWFEPLRDLGTEVIVETFEIEGVEDKVRESVEKCMLEDDTTECLEKEVDTVSDALGQDVPRKDRDDAKVKVAALSDFLGAVHGACRDVPEDKIGECAFKTGNKFCGESDFDKKECMMGVMFVLRKAKEMADKMEDKKSEKRGVERDDEWFEPLRDLGTEVIVETFGIEGVKDKVRESVEKCMQEDDVTDCMEDEVDTVSDALGQNVPKEDRDEAKIKVAALSDFLGAVHGACRDVPEDKIGECAFNTGKKFCGESDFDKKKCMRGVLYILGKAKKMAEKADME